MHLYKHDLLLSFTIICILGLFTEAHAIPAFSREHNTECSTCHTIYPELNEYGDVFLKNGFVWTKQKKEDVTAQGALKNNGTSSDAIEQEPVMGAPKKSEPLWLAGLPQTLPLSIAASMDAAYNDDSSDKVDLSTRSLSLLAGGVVRDKIGFFAKYNLYTQGAFNPALSNTPANSDSPYANDLEQLYIVWRKILTSPVSMKAGRFRPQLSLWQKTNKTGVSDFATTSFTVGSSLFRSDSPEDAVELNAVLLNRVYIASGIVDRDGQDTNEAYGHVSIKLGGSDFHAREPDVDLDNESILDYMYLVLGGYGYSGRNSGSIASNQRNNFYRAGADMDFFFKNTRLKGAWSRGRDTNPDFASHLEHKTDVYLAQGEFMFTPDFLAFFRYEYQDMRPGAKVKRYIPAVVFAPIQNTKITFEYQHVTTNDEKSNLALLGIRLAF